MKELRLSSRHGVDARLAGELGHALRPGGHGPSVFVVTGEAGAGKGHVLDGALSATPAARRRAAVSGPAHRAPYAVVSGLLGVDLGRPPPADAEDRLLSRLGDLCAAAPLVLAVEDVHDADAASLLVLRRMASAARDLPLALLLTRHPVPERDHLTRLLRGSAVREFVLPPPRERDPDALLHEHARPWPAHRLRHALPVRRDDARRVPNLPDGLERAGALTVTGNAPGLRPGKEAGEIARGGPGSAAAVVAALHGPAREVARILAVLGRPALVEEIAAVAAAREVSLVEPVQVLVDRGVADFDPDGRLVFTRGDYREAVGRGTPRPLLRVLHAAVARHEEPAGRMRHLIASAAPPREVLSAVRDAGPELLHAPAAGADPLAGVPVTVGSSPAAVALAIRRARALAQSGQPGRAETVARTALLHATGEARITELRRALMFSLTLRGDARGALTLLDESLAGPVGAPARRVLRQHRRHLTQLGGLEPLPLGPPDADPLPATVAGLAGEAVRLCLTGSPHLAVELAWEASRRHASGAQDPHDGASSGIWPPLVEMFANGPRAAADALRDVRRLRDERAAHWQSAPHEMLRAWIDMRAGRLEDAAAAYDIGLELADASEFGWTSLAVSGRAMIDVLRGETAAADARLSDWRSAPRTLQFGIPAPDRAEVALLEARRRLSGAARLARAVWHGAAQLHLYAWLAMVAPDFARLALRAPDTGLRMMIVRDLALLPRPLPPALAPSVHLAEALTGGSARDRADRAVAVAGEAALLGEPLTELGAWEEAAVAAADTGDKHRARQYAQQALRCAEETGAAGSARRVCQRLRAADVRLATTPRRRRPATGWEALTPTEAQVAELVASGLSGPGIARSMNVSARTVQSHVSRALAKLGLGSRIELAAMVRARQRL